MPVPKPGKPVRGSKTGRPIMALLDLLGRRWVLRMGWELRDGRTLSFRGLQEACGGLSPTVLNQRLRDLREAGLVELAEAQSREVRIMSWSAAIFMNSAAAASFCAEANAKR